MSKDIEVGQVWVRKGGTGFNEDLITILEDMTGEDPTYRENEECWEVVYGDEESATLPGLYIQREFEYQSEHPEEWEFVDNDGDRLDVFEGHAHDENVVFQTTFGQMVVLRPDEQDDLIHWLTTHRRIHRGL